jgi:hypothetical protein
LFYGGYENSFVALPCGNKIVGVNGSDYKTLILEDLTKTGPSSCNDFGNHTNVIYTVLYFEESQTLLAGGDSNCLKEYKLRNSGDSFDFVKDYGDIGIGLIMASSRIMNLAVFGGYNEEWEITVIDVKDQRKVASFQTAIRNISSFEICRIPGSKVFLTVFGSNSDFSKNKSDVFDISSLIRNGTSGQIKEFLVQENKNLEEITPLRKEGARHKTFIEKPQTQGDVIQNLQREIKDLQWRANEVPKLQNEIASLKNILMQKDKIIHLLEQNNRLMEENKVVFELKQENKKLKKFVENNSRSKRESTQKVVNCENSNMQENAKSQISESRDNNDQTIGVNQEYLKVPLNFLESQKKATKNKRIKKKNNDRANRYNDNSLYFYNFQPQEIRRHHGTHSENTSYSE